MQVTTKYHPTGISRKSSPCGHRNCWQWYGQRTATDCTCTGVSTGNVVEISRIKLEFASKWNVRPLELLHLSSASHRRRWVLPLLSLSLGFILSPLQRLGFTICQCDMIVTAISLPHFRRNFLHYWKPLEALRLCDMRRGHEIISSILLFNYSKEIIRLYLA